MIGVTMLLTKLLRDLGIDERGATAVEYGLIVSLIVIGVIGSLEAVANENTGLWAVVRSSVEASGN